MGVQGSLERVRPGVDLGPGLWVRVKICIRKASKKEVSPCKRCFARWVTEAAPTEAPAQVVAQQDRPQIHQGQAETVSVTVASELKSLAELHSCGALTSEEFAAAKRRVLNMQ